MKTNAYRDARTAATPSTPWTDHVHVPLGAAIAAGLRGTRITPNQVSLSAAVTVTLGVIALVALPQSPWGPVCFLVASFLGYTLDGVDGILARTTGQSSAFGSWLDLTLDRLVHMIVFAGFVTRQILIDEQWSAATGSLLLLWVLSATNAYAGSLLSLKAKSQGAPGVATEPRGSSRSVVTRLAAIAVDFGFLMTTLGFAALLGATSVAAWGLSAVNAAFLVALTAKARQQLAA